MPTLHKLTVHLKISYLYTTRTETITQKKIKQTSHC